MPTVSLPAVGDLLGLTSLSAKLEFMNPTGSFKDRGTSIMMSVVSECGVSEIVEDSSGNAGASVALMQRGRRSWPTSLHLQARHVPDLSTSVFTQGCCWPLSFGHPALNAGPSIWCMCGSPMSVIQCLE